MFDLKHLPLLTTYLPTWQDGQLCIPVINQVAWMDERPGCPHLVRTFLARRDLGERCELYRSDYRCNGYPCAFDDPEFLFKPGWARYAASRKRRGFSGPIPHNLWPKFEAGMLRLWHVQGDAMVPTLKDGQTVVLQYGNEISEGGSIHLVQLRHPAGLPVAGFYLCRVYIDDAETLSLWPDNSLYESVALPKDLVRATAVLLEGVSPDDVTGQLPDLYALRDGQIVSL